MTLKKLLDYKDMGILVPVILAVLLGIWAAYAYEAPEYDIVDSCTDTFTITYINDDGEIGQTAKGRLAWKKTEKDDLLCVYDPTIDKAAVVSQSIVDQYKDSIEGREYGWYRYAFWIPLLIFIVVFGIVLIVGWLYLSDFLLSRYVLAHPTRDNCMEFLRTKPLCGQEDVENVFSKQVLSLAAQKRNQWKPKFKPEFFLVLDQLLKQMTMNKNVVVNYFLDFKVNAVPMDVLLKDYKSHYLQQPDSDTKTHMLNEIARQESYNYHSSEIKTKADDIDLYIDELVEKIFKINLKESLFGFHSINRTRTNPGIRPGQLYVDVRIYHNLTPIILTYTGYSTTKQYYPGFDIDIKVYTYKEKEDKLMEFLQPEEYLIFRNTYRHNFTFNKQDEEDFNVKTMYSDAIKETLRHINENLK